MTNDQTPDARKRPSPGKHGNGTDRSQANTEAETEEEKIKREQATKPALMPIGDPSGAA